MSAPSAGPGSDEGVTATSLGSVLAGYDRDIAVALNRALAATSGLERVRELYQVRRVIGVHDMVLRSALCPLLEDLPGGDEVAAGLCDGCDQRAALLARFEHVGKNVAARDVYPVSGAEVEEILVGLRDSVARHVMEETPRVSEVLEASRDSVDPDVVAARMAFFAGRLPLHPHRAAARHPRSSLLGSYYRMQDRWEEFRDSHHGWVDRSLEPRSPRALQVAALRAATGAKPLTVPQILASYDDVVEGVLGEWTAAESAPQRASAAGRLLAAVRLHDSVLAGVLCPLLDAVPRASDVARALEEGCRTRAAMLTEVARALEERASDGGASEHDEELDRLVESVSQSFRLHRDQETTQVASVLSDLAPAAYRTRTSLLDDAMWPWHSEGPELLALRMALWAGAAPTRAHRLLANHPRNRALRSVLRFSDSLRRPGA